MFVLGGPRAASREEGIFMGESLQNEKIPSSRLAAPGSARMGSVGLCRGKTGKPGVLTIYMENPEIPVGKSNGTHHSIWSTSEIMSFWSK